MFIALFFGWGRYLGAELLDGESLDGVDVEGRVRVHGGETS
jgi:hypothetical protein